MRSDREEHGVEAASLLLLEDVRHLAVRFERDAEVEDPLDLGVEDVAREPVLRDAVAHHPAGLRAGVVDRHRVSEAGEVVRAARPDGPAPTIRTRFLDGGGGASTRQPRVIASSPRKRSTELIPTASSSSARLQTVSHGW